MLSNFSIHNKQGKFSPFLQVYFSKVEKMLRKYQGQFQESNENGDFQVKMDSLQCQQLLIHARYENYSFWKCELKPSKHACKIFSVTQSYVL